MLTTMDYLYSTTFGFVQFYVCVVYIEVIWMFVHRMVSSDIKNFND